MCFYTKKMKICVRVCVYIYIYFSIYNEILFADEKEGNSVICKKWMKLEDILSESSQRKTETI